MSLYTWKSIWAAKGLLQDGLGWRVGTRISIIINEVAWLPKPMSYKLHNPIHDTNFFLVRNLIDSTNRKWKEEIIHSTLQGLIRVES